MKLRRALPTWILVIGSILPFLEVTFGSAAYPVSNQTIIVSRLLGVVALVFCVMLYRRGVRLLGIILIVFYGIVAVGTLVSQLMAIYWRS